LCEVIFNIYLSNGEKRKMNASVNNGESLDTTSTMWGITHSSGEKYNGFQPLQLSFHIGNHN
jgi:hypothetical protein